VAFAAPLKKGGMRNENEKQKPRGIWGLFIDLCDSGALNSIPGAWAKVFIALYRHRNVKGFANPSQERLAKLAGVDERTVRKFIRWSKVSLGVEVRRGRYSQYYLPFKFEEPWFQGMTHKRKRVSIRANQHPQRTGEQKYLNPVK